jgi:hypothetical protein
MGTRARLLAAAFVAALVATLGVAAGTASAGTAHPTTVSAVPSDRTPQILDDPSTAGSEKVMDLEQAGGLILVSGVFRQVRDVPANGGATYTRASLFAFDAATGKVSTTFAPTLNGRVYAIARGPDNTVYLGGTFTILNGQAVPNLVQVSLATGRRVTAFHTPTFNSTITDLAVVGNRVLVAGTFTRAGGAARQGLASISMATGGVDSYLTFGVATNHNYPRGAARAAVGVENIAVNPQGTRMAVIGNFRTVGGQARDQVAMVRLNAASAAVDTGWRTRRFEAACDPNRWDTYVRDVDFAPNGTQFAVVTTGARYPGTLCDTVSAWNANAVSQGVQPLWIGDSGGDSMFAVEMTGSAVYVGGHTRWMNNDAGRDAAGAGAVPRPGIAALDVRTGVPLAWNPGRNPRGIGAEALLATADGLYVGMDTEYFGDRRYHRPRLGFFPLAGGSMASEQQRTLPANVVMAGRAAAAAGAGVNDVRSRYFTDTAVVGPDTAIGNAGLEWTRARGAFMVGNVLYYGYHAPGATAASTNYRLWKRTFDGTTFGPASVVDPYNDPAWSNVSAGLFSGRTVLYRGVLPAFYSQIWNITGMFYDNGRLYYTRSGASALYFRDFSVDSGVVGAVERVLASTGFSDVYGGLFKSGGYLYYASRASGELRKVAWVAGRPSGGILRAAHGTAGGGRDWRTRAMFLGPGSAPATATTAVAPPSLDPTGIAVRDVAASSADEVSSVDLGVPASVRAGDAMVLVLSATGDATGTAPDGWTLEAERSAGAGLRTQVWSRVAGPDDAGTTLTVSLSTPATATLQLAAYSGVSPADPVASVTGAVQVGGTAHTTPTVTVPRRSWVLSVWSDIQAAGHTWTTPSSGFVVRSNGGGTGAIATLLGDGGAAHPAGRAGGLTASVPTPSNAAAVFTVVLRPVS